MLLQILKIFKTFSLIFNGHINLFSIYAKSISNFLFTENGVTTQKRRLVAAKRLSASFDKGGLQILHPNETAEGL
jgi:hypothetical protein